MDDGYAGGAYLVRDRVLILTVVLAQDRILAVFLVQRYLINFHHGLVSP